MILLLLTIPVIASAQPISVDAGVGDPQEPPADAAVTTGTEPTPPEPEPKPEPAPKPIPSSPFTVDDVRGAPVPGQEHGRTDEVDTGDGAGRVIGRAFMWIPRIPFELVFQPIRGAIYVNERYNATRQVVSLFVTDDKKIAIFPTAFIETGFGLNAGIRGKFKDLFGANEQISLRAAAGGRERRLAAFEIETNKKSKLPVSTGLELRYETRNKERFFGYGNGDIVESNMPIDPLTSDDASSTRFGMELVRASPRLRVRLAPTFSATLTGSLVRKTYTTGTGPDNRIDEAFILDRIPRFTTGTTFVYSELELAWDTRRPAHDWDHQGISGTGGLALAYAARQQGLREGEIGFYRVGVDLQRLVRLTIGPRVLELRAHGELVTGGDRDEIAFTELPRLGGPNLLRGYNTDRFRDRLATLAQVTYRWSVSRNIAGSIFSDIGRVHAGLDDISLEGLRVGYGIALEAYSDTSMFIRFEVASSIDGGLFVYFNLNPVTDNRARVERY